MGLISKLFGALFGGKNIIKQTVEVFRPNAENQAVRSHAYTTAALAQFSSEFGGQGWFNRFVDGLNRLPRPAFALGTIALFIAAMFDPIWFGERMQGLVLVPEQLWWLLGVIVSFYFGARELHKVRSGGMAKEAARILAQAPIVADNIRRLRSSATPRVAVDTTPEAGLSILEPVQNQAVEDWRKS